MIAGGGLDQPAEDRLLADDLGVELEVGRGGHRVHQLGQVVEAAGRLQLASAEQLVAEGDVVDDGARSTSETIARNSRRWASR